MATVGWRERLGFVRRVILREIVRGSATMRTRVCFVGVVGREKVGKRGREASPIDIFMFF